VGRRNRKTGEESIWAKLIYDTTISVCDIKVSPIIVSCRAAWPQA
jgi:hypothetical protein